MTFYRVRNSKRGREYTVSRVADDEKVINEPAVGRDGRPLPGKTIPKSSAATKAPEKKTAAAKKTASADSSKAEKEATK